jgi:hypothetical protein
VFGADTVALETALKDTSSRVKQFSGQMQALGAQWQRVGTLLKGAAAIGALVGVGVAMNGTMKEIERLGDTAREIGMPVEQLTALKHAAESSGASIEVLSVGMKTLARNMAAAAADSRGSIAQAFRSVGVSVLEANGEIRSTNDVMLDFADRLSGMRDGAGKTALVMQLFGEQGTKLVRMLDSGSAGIKDMTAEARRLGVVIGADSVDSAQRYNAAMDRIGKTFEELRLKIASELGPTLDRLSQSLAAYTREALGVGDATSAWGDRIRGLEVAFARMAARWAVTKLAVKGLFSGSGSDEFERGVRRIWEELKAFEREVDATPRLRMFAEIGKRFADLRKIPPPIQDEMRRLREEFNYPFSDPFAGVATKIGLLNDAFKRGIFPLMEYRTMLRALQVEDMAELRAAAKATLEDTLADSAVTAADKMRALEQAVRAGTLTFGEFGAKAKTVTLDAMATLQASIEAFSSGMDSAFRQFTETGKVNVKDMTRSILSDLAQIAFKMMVLKPLFGAGDGKSGILGAIFGSMTSGTGGGLPGFASGGRPAVGMPAWVGERGRELFIPDSPGTIIPNHLLRDAGPVGGGRMEIEVRPSRQFDVEIRESMHGAIAERAPAIVGASVEATRRNLPGMMRDSHVRTL